MSQTIRNKFMTAINNLLSERNMSQKELAKAMKVSPTTVNNWVLGYNVPRMDKIDELSEYFGIERTDLIGKPEQSYYVDKETRKMADNLHKNKKLRLLFDAAIDAAPEDLETVHTMLLALKNKERGNDE